MVVGSISYRNMQQDYYAITLIILSYSVVPQFFIFIFGL